MSGLVVRRSGVLTVGSLFSGIEGFGLGFTRAGAEVVWHVEKDDACQTIIARHFGGQAFGDVHSVGRHNLRPVDLVCGGFPCQDLSVAGQRAGLAGERSGLWYEFHRVLAELTPEWVVIENVGGLLSSQSGRDMAIVLRGLAELGYWWAYRVLDSQYFGLAQRRDRVFIVGHLGNRAYPAKVLFEPESLPGHPAPSRTARQEVAGTLGGGSGERGWPQDVERMTFIPSVAPMLGGGNYGAGNLNEGVPSVVAIPIQDGRDLAEKGQNGLGIGQPGDPAYTVDTTGAGAVAFVRATRPHGPLYGELDDERWEEADVHPSLTPHSATQNSAVAFTERSRPEGRNLEMQEELAYALTNPGSGGRTHSRQLLQGMAVRRLTPLECERLQGFPEGWTSGLSDSTRYRLLGNAVSVPVAEWGALRITKVALDG